VAPEVISQYNRYQPGPGTIEIISSRVHHADGLYLIRTFLGILRRGDLEQGALMNGDFSGRWRWFDIAANDSR
jgi:hypothetical protein